VKTQKQKQKLTKSEDGLINSEVFTFSFKANDVFQI
jgi:hypothetical protein